MAQTDIDEIRKRYVALRDLIIRNPGGWEDQASHERLKEHCEAVRHTIEDAECAQHLQAVETQAAELYSKDAHVKWARKSMSGADYLRLQILIALEMVNTRLFMLDAHTRAVAAVRAEPASSRSNP